MNYTLSLFLSLWVLVSPLVIVVTAVRILRRIYRHRWAVHILTFIAMLSPMPAYILVMAIVDPTTIEHPGGGEGFLILLHLPLMIGAMICYMIYACQNQTGHSSAGLNAIGQVGAD